MRMFAIVALTAAHALLPPAGAAQEIDTLALRGHTRFLADDLLEGRGAGTRGERLAALYVASQLERLGIPGAAADGGYFQSIPLHAADVSQSGTSMRVVRGEEETGLEYGRDFVLGAVGPGGIENFAGPAVLATGGTPATPDLAGKVLVVLGGLGAEADRLLNAWSAAGAAAVISLIPEPDQYALVVRSRGASRYFVDADIGDALWQPPLPMLTGGPGLARVLLEGVRVDPESLRASRFEPVPLADRLEATLAVRTRPAPSANVAGLLPGRDPELRDELVVYTAHYDHLGVADPDLSGDSVYNGFSDNAAGVAMLLAIAQALRDAPLERSVLFLFFGAEERGLLGSSFYASQPLLPLDRIAALINLDAGAPPAPPVSWIVAGGEGTALGRLAVDVARGHGWTARPVPASPNSDYWPFVRRGVPAVFLIPGRDWEGVGAAEEQALRRRWDRYHQAGDEWAADFPFAGLARYAEYALRLGRAAAAAGSPAP